MPTNRQQKRLEVQRQIIKHFDDKIPSFTDIFDEKTFYLFAVCIVVFSIVAVVILSNCCQVKLNDADEIRRQRERRERKRKEKLAIKLLNDKIKAAKVDSDEYKELKVKLEILQRKIKEIEELKSRRGTIMDDTEYEFSDDDYTDYESNTSKRTSTTTLKSE